MNTKKIKFIYWFAYYNLDSPSVRYRAKYPLDFFKAKYSINSYLVIPGYKFDQIALFLKAYIAALLFRKNDSLIVIQRVQSNFIYSTLLKLLVKVQTENTIYDLDDSDYLYAESAHLLYFVRNCDKISSGSEEICKYLFKYNSNIFHVTSPIIDLNIRKARKNKDFVVGWIGGFEGRHKEGLINLLFPALLELNFDFKLVILGIMDLTDIDLINEYFKNHFNIKIEIPTNINWNDELYLQNEIVKFDIGIATLIEDEIQLSKSGIKAKQYMNNGVPVLSTNLLENNRYVIDGYNGFYCDTSPAFKKRILQFFEMKEIEYLTFSKNAANSIVHFDHEKYLSDLERIKNTP